MYRDILTGSIDLFLPSELLSKRVNDVANNDAKDRRTCYRR